MINKAIGIVILTSLVFLALININLKSIQIHTYTKVCLTEFAVLEIFPLVISVNFKNVPCFSRGYLTVELLTSSSFNFDTEIFLTTLLLLSFSFLLWIIVKFPFLPFLIAKFDNMIFTLLINPISQLIFYFLSLYTSKVSGKVCITGRA